MRCDLKGGMKSLISNWSSDVLYLHAGPREYVEGMSRSAASSARSEQLSLLGVELTTPVTIGKVLAVLVM